MNAIRELIKKHREVVTYLIFGVLTTFVGWGVYFLVLWFWKAGFDIPVDDTKSRIYLVGYTVAQVLHWIAAVLFAFFTNRKWVFTDADKSENVYVQLGKFAGGRVATFFIDYAVTLFVAIGLATLIPALTCVSMLGKEWNLAEIGAKVLAAVIVIIVNYFFSKIFVFKNKKS